MQLPRKPDSDFSAFRVDVLVDNSMTDFDLFIDLESHFILYSGNGYKWNREELTQLLRVGHGNLFIRKADLHKAEMYEQLVKLPTLDKTLAPPERIQRLEQIGAKFIQCLYEGELTEACVSKAATISDALVQCVAEDKGSIKYLSALGEHDYYTYFHSVRVAAYAVAIAVQMGLHDQDMLKAIAFGGIFHDIGKKDVPLGVLNKAGPLTDVEWKLMRSHPTQGFNSVSDTILAHVPREIILHHHEKRNGTGYPHGLETGSLIYEVQIATLADIFDALTSSRCYQNKRTRFEALDFIKNRLLKDEVCPESFKGLIHCLAS